MELIVLLQLQVGGFLRQMSRLDLKESLTALSVDSAGQVMIEQTLAAVFEVMASAKMQQGIASLRVWQHRRLQENEGHPQY